MKCSLGMGCDVRLTALAEQVWSEPEIVESAAYEFADTSEFLEAGMCGPVT